MDFEMALWGKVTQLEKRCGDYELIKRIIIEGDDVNVGSITADENDNGFALQEVALHLSAPTHTERADGNVILFDAVTGGGRILGFSEQFANTSEREFRLWAKKHHYGYDAVAAANGGSLYRITDIHSVSSDFVRCVKISLYSGTFANGTVIELWGVRA